MKSTGSIEQKAADEAAAVFGLESLDNLVCMDMAQFMGQERVGTSVLFGMDDQIRRDIELIPLRARLWMI